MKIVVCFLHKFRGRIISAFTSCEKYNLFAMVRSSKSVKRSEISAHGDNTRISSPPYYFRHISRDSTKSQIDNNTSTQNADNKSLQIIIKSTLPKGKFKYCTCSLIGIMTILVCVLLTKLFFPYPLHASCVVKWKFGDPCTFIMQKFRYQIMNWSSWNACRQHDVNCLYTLNMSLEDNMIRATHRMSNSKSHERIKISFEEANKTCVATAESISNGWFTVFDYGTNYCNLHSLVTGAGLNIHTNFLELTSDAVCTQFNMAICE